MRGKNSIILISVFLLLLLHFTILLLNVSEKKNHKMDCKVARESFSHALGYSLISDGFGASTAKNVYTTQAYKIILYTPYCFPQNLIEIAQQNYTP